MSDGDKLPAPPHKAPGQNTSSLSELIAQTPGAQTREQALECIKDRQQKRSAKKPASVIPEDQLAKPEPLPNIENPDQFAADFFERLKAKEKEKRKPPKRSKPRLFLDNDKSGPSENK